MSMEAWVEDLLPTKWSRRIALATIVIAGAAFGLPSLLPQSYLPSSPEQLFLIKLLLVASVALVGLFAVLALVVHAFNTQTKEPCAEVRSQPEQKNETVAAVVESATATESSITERHEKVLDLLFEGPRTVEKVRQLIGVGREQANFYLHDLVDHGLASTPAPYSAGPEEWHISQEGRRHVMQREP